MPRTRFVTLPEAAALIPDGAMVAVNSSSGLLCPDALLRALGERFAQQGHPQNLTTIHPIAAGDMYGIDGIDHIARPGLLARVIAGSLPSGPSSMESPAVWRMIYENEVEAYNIPSGLIFHQLREAAAKRPGVLTQLGMDTFLDPRRQGGRMNERTREDIVQLVEFDGQAWLYLRALHPDVALIRATTADELGNLTFEREGAFLGAYDVALAAHNNRGVVIAQVERRVAAGTLPAQDVRVPSVLVDAVVIVPDTMQTTQTDYDPAISGEVRVPFRNLRAGRVGPAKGDRPPRRARTPRRRSGQSRLRHLRARAPGSAGRGAGRRRHLGNRTGRRRRHAAAGLPVRLRRQHPGHHPLTGPVQLFPGRRLRPLLPFLHADRP